MRIYICNIYNCANKYLCQFSFPKFSVVLPLCQIKRPTFLFGHLKHSVILKLRLKIGIIFIIQNSKPIPRRENLVWLTQTKSHSLYLYTKFKADHTKTKQQ